MAARVSTTAWPNGSPSRTRGDIDVHVVTHQRAGKGFGHRRHLGLPRHRVWSGLAAALLLPPLLSAVLLADPFTADLPLDIPIFLLATVVVAVIGGVIPAVIAAGFSSVLLNWFFVQPTGTFTVSSPENTLALIVFVLVGVIVALIVHLNARRTEQAQAAQRESAALAELSHSLLGATDQLPLLLQRAVDMFGVRAAAIVHRPPNGAPEVIDSVGDFDPLGPADHEDAGGAHELVLQPPGLAAERRRLFDAFAAHAGAVLPAAELRRSAISAAARQGQRGAHRAAVGGVARSAHPLAGIKAAISSLRSTEVYWSVEDQQELQAAIEESGGPARKPGRGTCSTCVAAARWAP
ncbi:MAG: DUF4118 domain-containing protein [Micropruina sp.]